MSDFTLQPFPVKLAISNQSTYDLSRFHVKGMRALTKKINIHYATDPAKVAIRRAYDDMMIEQKGLINPVIERVKQFTNEQSAYLTVQRENEQQAINEITLQLTAKKRHHATTTAIELVRDGKYDQAQKLMSNVEMASPTIEATKPAESMTRWGYDEVDFSKLKSEFLKAPLPNRAKILAAVTKHHTQAEQIVGEGAIKVTSTTRPTYREQKL